MPVLAWGILFSTLVFASHDSTSVRRENDLEKIIEAIGSDDYRLRTAAEARLAHVYRAQFPLIFPQLERLQRTTKDANVRRTARRLLSEAEDIDFPWVMYQARKEIVKSSLTAEAKTLTQSLHPLAPPEKYYQDLTRPEIEAMLRQLKLVGKNFSRDPQFWKFDVTIGKNSYSVSMGNYNQIEIRPYEKAVIDLSRFLKPLQIRRFNLNESDLKMKVGFHTTSLRNVQALGGGTIYLEGEGIPSSLEQFLLPRLLDLNAWNALTKAAGARVGADFKMIYFDEK